MLSKALNLSTLALLFILPAFLRFYALSNRPLHNDEAVNAFFTSNLLKENRYHYDPANYHGPSLYYFQLPLSWLANLTESAFQRSPFGHNEGLNETNLRLMVAIAGVLVLLVLWMCKSILGPWAAGTAALLAGLSCDMVFFSRYFIHETYVVLFTLGLFFYGARWVQTRKPAFLYGLFLSASLLFCTKETSALHFFAMGLSAAATIPLTHRDVKSIGADIASSQKHLVWAYLLALLVWVLFFTSFFTHNNGLRDSFLTYTHWFKQGTHGHAKPFIYYLKDILFPYEKTILLTALVGFYFSYQRWEAKGIYLATWTLTVTAIYSLIPYKTPWLVINLILPLCLLSGYGVFGLMESRRLSVWMKAAFILGLVACQLVDMRKTLRLIFSEYEDARHPQVYAHTVSDVRRAARMIDDIAEQSGKKGGLTIQIVSPIYWPLPFYLLSYKNILFWTTISADTPLDADILIANNQNRADLENNLKNRYRIEPFTLRPGVPLFLYINENVLPRAEREGLKPVVLPALFSLSHRLPTVITQKIFSGLGWKGPPLSLRTMEHWEEVKWVAATRKPTPGSFFSVRWSGYFRVERPTLYRVSLESDDGSSLRLNGQTIIDNGGFHAVLYKSRDIGLLPGWHFIEIDYFDIGGEAVLHWKMKEKSLVPPSTIDASIPPKSIPVNSRS